MTEDERVALQSLLQQLMAMKIKLRDIDARLTAAEAQLHSRNA